MESPAFWLAFGAIIVALIWASSRERVEKQRTLQRLLERNEELDEDLVNRLLDRRGTFKPGDAYRRLRVSGAFLMMASIPVGGLAAISVAAENGPWTGVAVSGAVFFLTPFFVGAGLFLSARFYEKPNHSNDET